MSMQTEYKYPPPRKYSKRRIAEIQIFRAIKILEENNDPVSALTLAGAAEEILGKMIRDKGHKCAFDASVAWQKQMWDFAVKNGSELAKMKLVPSEDEIKYRTNKIRNELKHKCDGKPVEAYYRLEAEQMLERAISNYLILYQKYPKQKTIEKWFHGEFGGELRGELN